MKHETISRPRKRKPRKAADQTYGGLPVISTWGEIGKEIGVSDYNGTEDLRQGAGKSRA